MRNGNEFNTEYNNNKETKRNKRKKKPVLAKKLASIALSATLFGAVSGGAFYGVNTVLSSNDTVAESTLETTASEDSGVITTSTTTATTLTVEEIAETGLTSVVCITNVSVSEVEAYFGQYGNSGGGMFGGQMGQQGMQGQQTQTTESTSVGSGVIIYESDDSYYIVTNYHVIEDATTLSITFVDDETLEAEVCGYDDSRDIAVVKVSKSEMSSDTMSAISVAEIGSSDTLNVGETVIAIGNALGYGQSVTSGIVSAVDREISSDENSSVTNTYIQTDAAINAGNSGGAIFNTSGQLVGINTAKISETGVEGMGYAIPISEVLETIQSYIQQSTVYKGLHRVGI